MSFFFTNFLLNDALILNKTFNFSVANFSYLSTKIALNVVKTLIIKGILTQTQLSDLKNLNNNSNVGILKNLENISLPNQTGNIPNGCFYYGSGGDQWLKSFSFPLATNIGVRTFDAKEVTFQKLKSLELLPSLLN